MSGHIDGGMLGWTEGEVCGRKRCKGIIEVSPVENCSCHINPPCGACTAPREYCQECGWEASEDDWPKERAVAPGLAERLYKPTPLDPTKISFRSFPHSSSSMLKKGVYPEGATRNEVESRVRGTFGGRFESFGNGKFEYVAYTD